jgi:hypothetical protein
MALGVYDSVTWSGANRWELKNRPGEDARLVTRRGVPFVQAGGHRVYTGGRYLLHLLDEYAGRPGARPARQAMKALALAGLRIGAWPAGGRGRIPLVPRTRTAGHA